MRTQVFFAALLALAASRGVRAEDQTPDPEAGGEDEAQLQELERILAETAKPSAPSCQNAPAPVTFRRKGVDQPVVVSLLDCAGEAASQALSELSKLAQPPVVNAEGATAEGASVGEPAGDVLQLNPGLMIRLQRIAEHFPDHAIDVVSGIRPAARSGSRHRSGDALDIHVDGVEDLAVAEYARGFAATGVGYYPNSTFVHIDVRDEAFSWVDRSRPGEKPEYGAWPEPVKTETETETVAGTETETVAETETETVAETETETVAETETETETVSDSAIADPELAALADRALVVMNDVFSTNGAPGSVPAEPPAL